MLPFDQRACFIAGQAKSGTTLVAALLDNHSELLVLPQETAYFPTVLTKYRDASRRAQFDYLTKESFSRVLFGGEPKWREHEYANFPQQKFFEAFERVAFNPANTQRDLLALMAESYAVTIGGSKSCRRNIRAISASEAAGHIARSARDSGDANCAGKNAKDKAVLSLLRDRALARGREVGAARAERGRSRIVRPVRTGGG